MRTKFKKLILAMMLAISLPSFAHDFEADGIYYNISTDKTVSVTYWGLYYQSKSKKYTGSVTIPSTVTYNGTTYNVAFIGEYAFYECIDLTSVEIPNTVSQIGKGAFYLCSNLTSITIPNSVKLIGDNTFYKCSGLTEVNFNAENCTKMGSYNYPVFSGCSNLTNINIGNTVNTIPPYAFFNCSHLTEVTIPNSVTTIGQGAFQECWRLNSVTIGNSISTIQTRAFYDCDNLINVTCLNPMPQNIAEESFSSTTFTSAILTVPFNSSYVYAARIGWRNFKNVVEFGMPKVNLTLKFPESGTITHKEIYEETVDLSFKANPGWKINNITFNDVDITAELDEDGNYTTPILTADAVLVVVFEKIDSTSQLGSIYEKNNIKVYARNGEVRVFGAEMQSEVAIYNSSGTLVYKGFDNTIALNNSGVYILTIEGRTFKFAL